MPHEPLACVLVDEAQFLTAARSSSSRGSADAIGMPVLAYGLRTDFQGELFAGSARLLAHRRFAGRDQIGLRVRAQGDDEPARRCRGPRDREGAQTEIGGNDRYVALCRRHFAEALGGGERATGRA